MSKALDLLFLIGRPFSPLYSALMQSREKFYHRGIFKQHTLTVPVISVGNLMLGGTGKTPTVKHIAKLLSKKGYHPAVISRGYGGKAKEAVNIVSDGETFFLSPELAGDEPYMLARSLPGVPVLTGIRRIYPCLYSIEKFKCDIIILDDGFQHLSVKRDIDLVLFDSTVLAGNSRVFPGGPLREPASALNRCSAFILTGKNSTNEERTVKFSNLLQQRFPDRPVFLSSLKSYELIEKKGSTGMRTNSQRFFGFCGIATPSRFKNSLTELGVELNAFHVFKDHATYSQSLISDLCKKAEECGAGCLVTTEKDFVKLRNFTFTLPLFILKIRHKIELPFDQFLMKALENLKK